MKILSVLLCIIQVFLLISISNADVPGDVNYDNKIDLTEAIYALQVTAGHKAQTTKPGLSGAWIVDTVNGISPHHTITFVFHDNATWASREGAPNDPDAFWCSYSGIYSYTDTTITFIDTAFNGNHDGCKDDYSDETSYNSSYTLDQNQLTLTFENSIAISTRYPQNNYYEIYGAVAGDYRFTVVNRSLIGTSATGNTFDISGFDRFIIFIPATAGKVQIDAIGLDDGWVRSASGQEYAHCTAAMIATDPSGSIDPDIEGPRDGKTIENIVGEDAYYHFSTQGGSIMTVCLNEFDVDFSEYFPVCQSSQWQYATQHDTQTYLNGFAIGEEKLLNDVTVIPFNGIERSTRYYRINRENNTIEWHPFSPPVTLPIKANFGQVSSGMSEADGQSFSWKIEYENGGTVTTPADTFQDTVLVKFYVSEELESEPVSCEWYAKGVGMIKHTERSAPGETSYPEELTWARVCGEEFGTKQLPSDFYGEYDIFVTVCGETIQSPNTIVIGNDVGRQCEDPDGDTGGPARSNYLYLPSSFVQFICEEDLDEPDGGDTETHTISFSGNTITWHEREVEHSIPPVTTETTITMTFNNDFSSYTGTVVEAGNHTCEGSFTISGSRLN